MSPRRTTARLGALAAVLLALPVATAPAAPDDLVMVSRASPGPPPTGPNQPSTGSIAQGMSADGARVLMMSNAPTMVPGLTGQHLYVADVPRGTIDVVDRADGADGAVALAGTPFAGGYGAISADGRYVTFTGTFDGAEPEQVWRRDLQTGHTDLVSRADGPDGAPLAATGTLEISATGRYVSFTTNEEVVPGDPQTARARIYVRDMLTGRNVLANRGNGLDGDPTDRGTYARPSGMSPGGRYLAFSSDDPSLLPAAPGPFDATSRLWLRDLRTGRTLLVSRADGASGAPVGIYTGVVTPVSAGGCRVAFAGAGAQVAPGAPPDGGIQVYVRDLCAGTTTLVSRQTGTSGLAADVPLSAGARGFIAVGGMDASGTRVLFDATATNLAQGTTRQQRTAYVRDVAAGTTTLVSRAAGADGTPAAGAAYGITGGGLTPDGRYALFRSNDAV
ncbi:MAG: hypothetical protein AAGC46_11860, partial [Solirubrobacteraceae bacterium]|nr:hypothetical protein [Patulibacter sp.]